MTIGENHIDKNLIITFNPHYICNLGEIYNKDGKPIIGELAALSWQNGVLKTQEFLYSSENGIPPKVLQFEPEDKAK